MIRQYFGTDGIRGTVGQPPITPDFVLKLAHAVGRVLKRTEAHPTVLIGKDTRISGYMLESALESGFNSAGVDVVLLGPVPTPAVAYLTRAQRASLGVVISASHNPFADNGIKFFSAHGTKLSDAWESDVELALQEPPVWVPSHELGKTRRLDDAAGRYIEFCKSTFPTDLTLKGFKLVVDGAHGAAYQIAPKVFHELGADVVAIGCSPDGLNINRDVGATHPAALVASVKEHGADIGIALDGDADRLQMVDAAGRIYNGDELLYIMATERLYRMASRGLTRGPELAGVVGTQMTNMAVELALLQKGFEFVRAKVGDRYVLEALETHGWMLGGEGSGHLLALDRHTTGDGLVSALQILMAMVRMEKTMQELLADVVLFPQVLVNIKLTAGFDWKNSREVTRETEAVTEELGGDGRVLIRASGTEPLLRIMVEARNPEVARGCADRLVRVVQTAL